MFVVTKPKKVQSYVLPRVGTSYTVNGKEYEIETHFSEEMSVRDDRHVLILRQRNTTDGQRFMIEALTYGMERPYRLNKMVLFKSINVPRCAQRFERTMGLVSNELLTQHIETEFGVKFAADTLKRTSTKTEYVEAQIEVGHKLQHGDHYFTVAFIGEDGAVVLKRDDGKSILIRNTDKDAVKAFGLKWQKKKS